MSLTRLRPIWPFITLLASGAMLAAAILYFQGALGLDPCPLCLDQRNWHWGVVGVSVAALLVSRLQPKWSSLAIGVIGLVLLGSAAQGAYHVAVEQHWVTASCDANVDFSNLDPFGHDNARIAPPRCDEIAWQLGGISMAGYNAIVSFLLAVASFVVAIAPRRPA